VVLGGRSVMKREKRLRTIYRPINGETSIVIGSDPSTKAAKAPIPAGDRETAWCEATKTRYGKDPKKPVHSITTPRLRPSVGAGLRRRRLAARDMAKHAIAIAISINANCVVVMAGGERSCRLV
jgi:hypothetical protein